VPAVKTNSDLSHSDSPAANNDYIFFPSPLKEKVWHTSFGFTLTEMPVEITEEAQLRAPAIDYHVLRRLGKGFYLDGRINSQIVQNHFSIGPRWGMDLSNKFSFSLGDDLAWWFGILNVEGFKTKANGWMNYPGISLGYRLKRELLLTLREEAEISLSYQSKVGDQKLNHYNNQFVGWSTAVYLEQPFFSQTHVTLGLKIRYSKFYWQAWSLFSTFDRYLLYPEINVGFIL
jgi:hypothetical protein